MSDSEDWRHITDLAEKIKNSTDPDTLAGLTTLLARELNGYLNKTREPGTEAPTRV